MAYRISVDTGGTFTDVVVADADGRLHIGKALTTPERASVAVIAAIRDVARSLDRSEDTILSETALVIYGTTRATNAIVERKVAKTAFLTTEGFPDILLFKEGGKLDAHRWDEDFPKPYIPRRWTFEVPERITSEGEIRKVLDEGASCKILEGLRDKRFEAVAVCLLWSVVNPKHEIRVGELIERILPGVPYTLSHELNPILREYRRASSTAIDASLAPLMRKHLAELEADLAAVGFRGELLVSTSIGGVMHIQDAIKRPILLTKSGPSMAPIAGHLYAAAENLDQSAIVCDAGGTTFDVSLVNRGEVKFTRDTWIGGQFSGDCVGLSSVDVRSIGSGGGSIAWIDSGGLLRVGPHSAGASPGPVCYGRGGKQPTVTDAALVLGYVDPDYFLGGQMKLDVIAARAAMRTLSDRLGHDAETTAAGILSIANEHMVRAIQEITVNDGYNPKDSAIVAGGGSCGLTIMQIARTLGCSKVILPRTASALSACGAQFSNFAFEKTAACAARTDAFDYAKVNGALKGLAVVANRFGDNLAKRGVIDSDVSFYVEARYLHEAWEIEVPLARGEFSGPPDIEAFVERFHGEHERVFAVRQDGQPVECLSWKARFSGRANVALPAPSAEAADREIGAERRRSAYFVETGYADVPVHFGEDLAPGARIRGPAIIEEPTTTIVVYPGMIARVGRSGSYVLEPFGGEATEKTVKSSDAELDAISLSVIANRFDSIVREMSNTLLRTGRSAVINQARDFSCSIVTGDHELLAVAEGVPVHVFGSHLQTASVDRFHSPKEGDAYLHNDPYLGNTHPADHTIIVPVFVEGELMFYSAAKAHQADIGNAYPSTYAANAVDVYNEGGLIFPCVRVHQDYREIDDFVRMCRSRIRVPEQWYGDFLAAVGAARIGERKLKALVAEYGRIAVRQFIRQWLAYSERRMASAISKLPAKIVSDRTEHDPIPAAPNGIPVQVTISVDPSAKRILVDLRDNPDCVPCGLNLSQACSASAVINALFNCLEWDIPKNSGSFRCFEVLLRENCCVGIPRFPHSCSMATTNLTDRVVNVTQSAFAQLGDGFGLAQGGNAMGAPMGVISGLDARHGDEPYINQIFVGKNGGPAGPFADGWVTYVLPNAGGVTYRDSIELDELKHPIHIDLQRLARDTGGAGRFRGAPAAEVVYAAKGSKMTVVIPSDGQFLPPQGVLGGQPGAAARTYKIERDGTRLRQPNVCTVELEPEEKIYGLDCGGGGYGDPLTRDVHRVYEDVIEGWVSVESASEMFGVILKADDSEDGYSVDRQETQKLRKVTDQAELNTRKVRYDVREIADATRQARKVNSMMLRFMSGFGNDFETEALEGALPQGQNSPQTCAYGLYAEQLSGSPFTAPRRANERSWLYRIRPSVKHVAQFRRVDLPFWKTAPHVVAHGLPLGQLRWGPVPIPSESLTFLTGLRTMTTAGDVYTQVGMAAHVYLVTAPMTDDYFYNADGEMLIAPQAGRLLFFTELGKIDVGPGDVAVVPRGMKFKVEPVGGSSRGYVCENYGAKFTLPERGPIGANCLANPRDFKTPVAAYEDKDSPCRVTVKWCGGFHQTEINHSPLDVVAWHGNYAPYKYDLRTFSPVGAILFDHPDPSIFTVLTAPTGEAGTANVDFVIFPERWLVAEHSFRPPWYHMNIMSEFMGLIYGRYDAKEEGFVPGGMSLHNCMLPHGPDANAFEKASSIELKPVKLTDTLAFMFETRLPQQLTSFAASLPSLQKDYPDCWRDIVKKFEAPESAKQS